MKAKNGKTTKEKKAKQLHPFGPPEARAKGGNFQVPTHFCKFTPVRPLESFLPTFKTYSPPSPSTRTVFHLRT
jgi:hypothetical protein